MSFLFFSQKKKKTGKKEGRKTKQTTETSAIMKAHTKSLGVCFVLTWRVAFIPSNTPLTETNFPSPSRYQLPMASWLGVGFCFHFCFSVLGFYLCRFSAYFLVLSVKLDGQKFLKFVFIVKCFVFLLCLWYHSLGWHLWSLRTWRMSIQVVWLFHWEVGCYSNGFPLELHLSWNFSLVVFTMTNLFCTFSVLVIMSWLMTNLPMPRLWRSLILPPPPAINCLQLLNSYCELVHPSPTHARSTEWLDLVRVLYKQGHLAWVHECKDSVSPRSSWLPSLIVFLPLPWHSLSIEWWRDCDINVTFRAEFFADTLHFDQCIDPSLPYEDSSLMRIESHISLWVQR